MWQRLSNHVLMDMGVLTSDRTLAPKRCSHRKGLPRLPLLSSEGVLLPLMLLDRQLDSCSWMTTEPTLLAEA